MINELNVRTKREHCISVFYQERNDLYVDEVRDEISDNIRSAWYLLFGSMVQSVGRTVIEAKEILRTYQDNGGEFLQHTVIEELDIKDDGKTVYANCLINVKVDLDIFNATISQS